MTTAPKTVAVILSGAVAQGAFEAGVLKVLAEAGVRIARIVAASSGALNGAYFASAVRNRRERLAADELIGLWQDHASWSEIFHVNLKDLLLRAGLSDQARLRRLLRDHIQPTQAADPAPVSLQIVVAPLDGTPGTIGPSPATSYEKVLEFQGEDFDSAERLENVFTAAVASASFPLLFAPTQVIGSGPCIDGGAVNNTPIKYALSGAIGDVIDAIVVVSPTVADVQRPAGDLAGVALIGQLVDMLINERLYRDLRDHDARNVALTQLAALTPSVLSPEARLAVLQAIGWQGARVVDAVQIRPLEPLPGTAFSGFYRADLRQQYIDVGIARAQSVLGALGWSRPPE